jgi:hypothetical protein
VATGPDAPPGVVWPLGGQADDEQAAADAQPRPDADQPAELDEPSAVANAYLSEIVGSPAASRQTAFAYVSANQTEANATYDLNGVPTLVSLQLVADRWYVTGATTHAAAIAAIEPSPAGVAVTVALPDPDAIAYARLELIDAVGDPVASKVLSRNRTPGDAACQQIPGTCVLTAPAGSVPVVAQLVTYGPPDETPGELGSGVPIAIVSARVPAPAAATASPPGAPVSSGIGTPLPSGIDPQTASQIIAASERYTGDPTWTDWRSAVEAWLKLDYDPARWTGPPVLEGNASIDSLGFTGRYTATDGGTGTFHLARLSLDGPWFLLDLKDDTVRVSGVERAPGGLEVTIRSDAGESRQLARYDEARVAHLTYVRNGADDRRVRLLQAWLPDDDRPNGLHRPPAAMPGPVTAA